MSGKFDEIMQKKIKIAREESLKKGLMEGRQEGESDGLQKGRSVGRLEGRQEGRQEVVRSMVRDGSIPLSKIAEFSGLTIGEVESIRSSINA